MQGEKVDSILAESSEETFEFAPVQQIDDDRYVSNVQNHSHDDEEAHIYSVFVDVAREGTVIGAHVADCGCPADEYHDGECKHREAASECGELVSRVIARALSEQPDGQGVTDGGEVA